SDGPIFPIVGGGCTVLGVILTLMPDELIILSSTIQLFRAVPPFGKVAADKEFPISTDGFLYDFASIFCNKKTCCNDAEL
ncbi:MAG: hypothetical protein ACFNLV_04920, partial [Prevotella nigrescens]